MMPRASQWDSEHMGKVIVQMFGKRNPLFPPKVTSIGVRLEFAVGLHPIFLSYKWSRSLWNISEWAERFARVFPAKNWPAGREKRQESLGSRSPIYQLNSGQSNQASKRVKLTEPSMKILAIVNFLKVLWFERRFCQFIRNLFCNTFFQFKMIANAARLV